MRAIVLVVLLMTACTGVPVELTDDDRRAFAWFDGLGFPSTEGRPFVLVDVGQGWDEGSRETVRGFLLAEHAKSLSVLTNDLVTWTVPKADGVRYERLDLARAAADLPAIRDTRPTDRISFVSVLQDRDEWAYAERLGAYGETFVLARHCAANGFPHAAHDLLEAALRATLTSESQPDPRPVEHRAASLFDTSLIWRATIDCSDPNTPRDRLLAEFRRFVASFPKSDHVAQAKEAVAVLEVMAAEDAEHAMSARPWDSLTKDEQIAELIWRLRDDGGMRRWVRDDREEAPKTFEGLVAIGFDAVPRLIAAIGDRRFTRRVDEWRHFCFSHSVSRVGYAALRAIEGIAHRSFSPSSAAAMTSEERAAETRRLVETWWAEHPANRARIIPPR